MPDPRGSNSYSSQTLLDVDRRYRLLSEEVPELDPSTMYKLASTSPSDNDAINLGLQTIAAGSMENFVMQFKDLPDAEQRSRWARMSPSRQALYEQNGYKPPQKSDSTWWHAPFAAIGWVADKIGFDSLVENAKIVEFGQWGMDKVSNLADDVAGRVYRVNKDLSSDEQKARIENRLNQSIARLADEGYAVSDSGAEYLKWRLLEEEKEFTARSEKFGSTNTGIGGAIMRFKSIFENNAYDQVRYQPRSAPNTPVNVPDQIFDRFAQINGDLKSGKEFSLKPRDAWNRVDQGESYIAPTVAAKIQETLKGKEAATFNAALELSRGKSLAEYVKERELLDPQTPEFTERMKELSTALDSQDTKDAIEMAAKDQSKISLGRDFAKSLFIGEDSPLFTLVSGAVDAIHVVVMDPFLIAGKGLKLARVAKYGISSVEEIGEMQKLFRFAQAGGQIGEDGRLVFEKSIDELDTLIADTRSQISSRTKDMSESTLKKLRTTLRDAEAQRTARTGLVYEGADITRTNDALKELDALVPRETLSEYGLNSLEDILDANGLPTQWAIDNRDALYQFLKDAGNELEATISSGSLALTKGITVNGKLIDPETGEILDIAADLPASRFNFDALDELGFDIYYSNIEGLRHTLGRIYDPAEIAAIYNGQRGMLAPSGALAAMEGGAGATQKAARGSGLLNQFAASAETKPLGPIAKRFGSMSQRLATARMEQANRVGAWAERAAEAFRQWDAGDNLAFNKWLEDVPNAISTHNDLLALHNRLILERGYGIVNADDIFEYWKTSKALLNLARGRGTNIAIKGFGAGYAWNPANRLFASALEDVPLVRDRAGLIMMPRYNGRTLTRRVLNTLTNDRVNTLSDAIARGMEIGVSGSRPKQIAGKAVRGPSKFLYALTRQIPRNTFVDLNDLAELKRFVDSTAFAGFDRVQRETLWGQILGGMATQQNIRFVNAVDDVGEVTARLARGLADPAYANSPFAQKFFGIYDPQTFPLFDGNAASKVFEDNYDNMQRWIVETVNDSPDAIDDIFMRDLASFRRDYRPVVSIATRRNLVENAIAQVFRNVGAYNSAASGAAADEFLGKLANQRYSAIGNDIVNIGSETRRIGVLPVVHYSNFISLPNFGEDMVRDYQQAGFLQKILKQLNRPTFDKIMSKYWKPAVLLRIGFIPRAVGEEALAVLARSGFDAAQAIAGSFALKTSRGPITGTLASIARAMGGGREDLLSIWDRGSELGRKYSAMTQAIGYESVHDYMKAASKEFFGEAGGEFSKWDVLGFHANYMTAQVMSKIRKFEYSLLPDRIKAALPGAIRNEEQRALYESLGFAGTNPALRDWVNDSARALLRNPLIQEANVRSLAGVGHTIADDTLGGFAPTEGRKIMVKESGTEAYELTLNTDHQWIEYDLTKGIGSGQQHFISYPYALNTADPTMQVMYDATAGVVTPAEVSEGLLHSLSQVATDPVVYRQVPAGLSADTVLEDVLASLEDDFGRPLYSREVIDSVAKGDPALSVDDQKFINDWITKYNDSLPDTTDLLSPLTREEAKTYSDWARVADYRNHNGENVFLQDLSNDEVVAHYIAEIDRPRGDLLPADAPPADGMTVDNSWFAQRDEAINNEYARRVVDGQITQSYLSELQQSDEFIGFAKSLEPTVDAQSLNRSITEFESSKAYYSTPAMQSRFTLQRVGEAGPNVRSITIGQVMDEFRAILRGNLDLTAAPVLSRAELVDFAQNVINHSNLNTLPEISVRSRMVPSMPDIIDSANKWRQTFLSDNPDFFVDEIRGLLQGYRSHASDTWLSSVWDDATLSQLTDIERSLLTAAGPESKYSEYLYDVITAANKSQLSWSLRDRLLIANRDTVSSLLSVPKRYAQLLVGDADIAIRSFAEHDQVLRDAVYRTLDNMLRSPTQQKFVSGSERLLYDVSDRLSNAPVVRAPQPGAKFTYGVMGNRSTVDHLQKIYNENGVEEFLTQLRSLGMTQEQDQWLRQMFLEWDSRAVNRLITNNEMMLNGDYMPFSKIGFASYEDANAMSELLSRYNTVDPSVPAPLMPSGRSTYLGTAPGYVEIPTFMQELQPERQFFQPLENPKFGRWSNDGVIAQMSPYSGNNTIQFDDLGNIVRSGGHPIEGVTVDQALRNMASIIVDEFKYYYETPRGYLHEVIEPSRRGTFGTDVFDGIAPNDLPAKIYAPREYIAPKDVIGDLVRKGFDKVINPPILAMVRTPQWIMNFSDGLLTARTIMSSLRDPDADKIIFKLFATEGADIERIRDLYAMAFYQNGGPIRDAVEFRDAISFLIKDEALTDAVKQSAEYRLLGRMGSDSRALVWARRDKHVEDAVFNVALDRAVEATIPYIDDHSVRSIFQVYVRNIMPFQFAQEAFIKRWVRTVTYSPEAIRRAQLIAHGFTSLPFMHKDENGQTMFMVPLSETAGQVLAKVPVLNALWGNAARVPMSIPLSGSVQYMLPGIPNDFGQLPSVSPLIMFPAQQLVTHFPEVAGFQTRNLIRPFTGGMPVKSNSNVVTGLLETFMPVQYARMASAMFGGFGRYGEELNGLAIGAVQQMAAEAIRLRAEAAVAERDGDMTLAASLYERAAQYDLPTDATAIQTEKWLDNVKEWSRANMFVKGFFGLLSPSTPKETFEGVSLSKEYADLLNYMSLEEATAFFLAEHPDAQPYTVFKFDKETDAPLPTTQRSLAWMDKNRNLMGEFKFGSPWLMPQQDSNDEFSQQAFADQQASGIRYMKSLETWYRDFKFTSAANIYFPEQEAFYFAVDAASSATQKAQLRNRWQIWSDAFKKQHPIFAEELATNFDTRAENTLKELKTLLSDPELQPVEHHDSLREMIKAYEIYDTEYRALRNDNTKLGRQRKQRLQQDFLVWGSDFIQTNRVLTSFWNTVIIPATNLRRQENLMSLTAS